MSRLMLQSSAFVLIVRRLRLTLSSVRMMIGILLLEELVLNIIFRIMLLGCLLLLLLLFLIRTLHLPVSL